MSLRTWAIADPFIAEIVYEVEELAFDQGYVVFLHSSHAEPQRQIVTVQIPNENRVQRPFRHPCSGHGSFHSDVPLITSLNQELEGRKEQAWLE